MESPFYEMTHDYEAENKLVSSSYNNGYANGYLDGFNKQQERIGEQLNEIAILQTQIQNFKTMLKEQEAKTGHWVSVNDGDNVAIDNDGFPERACYCSECKKYLIASDEYAVYGRYCPFCGAKMEGR